MNYNLNIKVAEVLDLIEKTKSLEDKLALLNFNESLKQILQECYSQGFQDACEISVKD